MAAIARAAVDLADRLACHCASCGTPGFGFVGRLPGLPCRWCGTPTNEPLADAYACVRCDHRESRPKTDGDATADPGRCDVCNP
jgi:hypothetical protein